MWPWRIGVRPAAPTSPPPAPNAGAFSRIWFEGWAEGAKLRDYNAGYWEIVPFSAPEPSTYGVLLGIVGAGAYLIRRKRKTAARGAVA